jgi:multidrug efflux pump
MKYLPITLIAVLAASLLMALVFVPALGAIFGRTGADDEAARLELAAAETGSLSQLTGITSTYLGVLERALRRPWWSIAGVTTALITIYITYGAVGHGVEFFPDVEPEFATVHVRARGNFSVAEKDAMIRQVEERVLGMDELQSVYTRVGGGDGDEVGLLQLQFVDWEQRRPAAQILDEIRANTADLVGLHIETREPQAGPGGGRPIQLDVSARDPELLSQTVDRIRSVMDSVEGIRDVTDDRAVPGIEWRVRVDRTEAARFGADVTLIGNAIQLVTSGLKLDEYRPDDVDDEIDIRVRYPEASRTLDMLDRIRVETSSGSVPISTFVTRVAAPKVGTITRTDLRRAVRVEADVVPGVVTSLILQELRDELIAADLDPSVIVAYRGEDEDQAEASAFLSKAFASALLIIAIILVTQFNSFYQAFLILTAVVFSTGGVMLGHLIMAKPFGIVMSGIGVIALAGIVVNNNIVLIDTYNILRRSGMDAMEAVLRTSAQRFRPVLLTTVTTILGLMPMVLGMNIDLINRHVSIGGPSTQWWTQLASAIAGGLAFATVLTLLLTPCLLMLQGRREDARKH